MNHMTICWTVAAVICNGASIHVLAAAEPVSAKPSHEASYAKPQEFDSARKAADALIAAAEKFDVPALQAIFGTDGRGIFLSDEPPQDRNRSATFAREARARTSLVTDSNDEKRMFLAVGPDQWPFPAPIVENGGHWSFDAEQGRQELLHRRIGANELDAIKICRGYVEAQFEYAMRKRARYETSQYAQRIVSTPGKQDGLAWRNADGSWDGPVGERIALAIQQGYARDAQPYHGYFFKILTGQGPAARGGSLDFVVKGVMIGGFALVAAPAEYGVTGVKTFIVSHDGVVYEKDFGSASPDPFKQMERFDPDASWSVLPRE